MLAKALPALAVSLIFAAPLAAQDTDAARLSQDSPGDPGGVGASMTAEMLEDANIVSLQGQYDEGIWTGGAPLDALVADLTEIGEVEDIILSADGQVEGVTTDVGGFLGIGQKAVLIPLADMRLFRAPDSEDITVITRMSDQALKDAPEFALNR